MKQKRPLVPVLIILFCIIGLAAGCGIGFFCIRYGNLFGTETEAMEVSAENENDMTVDYGETTAAPASTEVNAEANDHPEDPPAGTEYSEGTADTAESEIISENVSTSDTHVDQLISNMSLEDKVAQMFIVLPEQLTGSSGVTAAGEMTQAAFNNIPVGGMIYMEPNLQSWQQIKDMLTSMQSISMARTGLPAFLCVDEEGGSVSRINGRGIVDSEYIGDMADIGAMGDAMAAYDIGDRMGTYLSQLGFNVDFAPCADVLTNPENTVVRRRSFGGDPFIVTSMCSYVLKGLQAHGVMTAYKHFPGHGATSGDTHAGMAYTNKTLEEMESAELVPFKSGVTLGTDMIMVGHISAPAVTGDDTPASMSKIMITDILRDKYGYDGLVVTDAMNMGAIAQNYSSASATIASIKAGADLILMPADLSSAYYGVVQAVRDGEISEERINESMVRILKAKMKITVNQ